MNRSELESRVAERTGLAPAAAKGAVDAVLPEIAVAAFMLSPHRAVAESSGGCLPPASRPPSRSRPSSTLLAARSAPENAGAIDPLTQ